MHHPDSGTAVGSDHFVVVLDVDEDTVRFHDPHGHPFATLSVDEFLATWRADTIGYATEPYAMRAGFQRTDVVDVRDALRRSLPAAVRWLDGCGGVGAAADWLGGAAAIERLAERVEAGLDDQIRGHLVYFAIRVGARRLADTSHWLADLGHHAAAGVADRQAQLVGGLQYDLVNGDSRAAAAALRRLAPTYQELSAALTAVM